MHSSTPTPEPPVRLSEAVRQAHAELWPGYQSTLAATDPELLETFDNFAYDEVLAHDALPTPRRVLLLLAAALGSHAVAQYGRLLEAALNVGVSPTDIKEVLYQSIPYIGFARMRDFLPLTNERLTARGVSLPLPRQATVEPATRYAAGYAVRQQVVGDGLAAQVAQWPSDLQHLQHYLSANCFGDYYTRGGLDLPTRELVTFAILVALGGAEAQLKGHIQGNAHVGNGRQVLIDVLTQLLPFVGYPRTLNAVACLNEVLPPT